MSTLLAAVVVLAAAIGTVILACVFGGDGWRIVLVRLPRDKAQAAVRRGH